MELYPGAKNSIGPAIDNGFYYDFDFQSETGTEKIPKGAEKGVPSESDLLRIEQKMREIIKSWKKFEAKSVDASEARETFKANPYKLELIDEIVVKKEKLTLYTCGSFTDLCRGGHADNPSKDIDGKSWKLSHIAGAYWRGDEKNKMLTRIYGLAFDNEKELTAYESRLREAKKRDHKKLGPELDLFTFSPLVGAGLPLWTPKGTLIRDLLDSFVFELRQKAGYERVDIPHITKKDLYEKSGHWSKFGDELFRIITREGHEFVMKPMNCPHHTQIYSRRQWSYREMPQRYASTTKVYRDEQSGELAGLSRVRSITQDDAHVFCRMIQAKNEIKTIWNIVETFYGAFGFKLTPRLSLHDPRNMSAYLGTEEIWQKAEDELRAIVKEKKTVAAEALGEAAFYGPKVDFLAEDSIGREWQVATIQLDINMPERFDLTCVNEKGEKERIVMIHTAIMGSIERFLSVLIEHLSGAFPLWLSPIQVKVIPVGEKQANYAKNIIDALGKANIRAKFDDSNETLGKKVRTAKLEKVPYFVVVGEKEIETSTVTVEGRAGKIGAMELGKFIEVLADEIRSKETPKP